MAKTKKNLYLYGVLLCFIGIIIIFFLDGYLGIYDVVYIKHMEQEQKFEFDIEQVWKPHIFSRSGNVVSFRYEIHNRSFFTHSNVVHVSLWRDEKQVMKILEESIAIRPFDRKSLIWALDTTKVAQPIKDDVNYTLKIKAGKREREFIITIGPTYIEEPPHPKQVPPLQSLPVE